MTIELPETAIRRIEGHDDVVAFQYDFGLEGKAAEDQTVVHELDDGDLLIEGWAADFSGLDRQNENFVPGAFERGIKSFLEGQAALCYHHRHADVLGKVLDLREEDRGLRLKARVDGAIKNHPTLGPIYEQIKKGTITGLSVGGFFRRKLTEAGYRIADVDMTEISCTGVPVHGRTGFAVVAGKALADLDEPGEPVVENEDEPSEEELTALGERVDALAGVFAQIDAAREAAVPTPDEIVTPSG